MEYVMTKFKQLAISLVLASACVAAPAIGRHQDWFCEYGTFAA